MNEIEVIRVIEALGQRMGVSLVVEDGSAAFEEQSGGRWLIEVSPTWDNLFIHTPVIEHVDMSAAHWRQALAVNFRTSLIRGCHLALNEQTDSLRLCCNLNTDLLSIEALENLLLNMMEVKENLFNCLINRCEGQNSDVKRYTMQIEETRYAYC